MIASNDGGFVSVRRPQVLDYLRSVLPASSEYLPKIHGPLPYLLSQLRKRQGLRVAPADILSRFAFDGRSSREEIPFTISGTMASFSAEDRRAAIESCPEIKVSRELRHRYKGLFPKTHFMIIFLTIVQHCMLDDFSSPRPSRLLRCGQYPRQRCMHGELMCFESKKRWLLTIG